MFNKAALRATQNRQDLSRYLVHLTRNDASEWSNGGTARENFLSILRAK